MAACDRILGLPSEGRTVSNVAQYVVSGSDGGHVFIWDKKTSQLVNILEGDNEVVNVIQGEAFFGTRKLQMHSLT